MSRYDPQRHHRRTIRLRSYNYQQAGAYFVTFCTQHRVWHFADPALAGIAEEAWLSLATRFPAVRLDAFVVMPNHVHFVLFLQPSHSVEPLEMPRGFRRPAYDSAAPELGEVVRVYKAVVARRARQLKPSFGWQRNYWEHVVRDERALHAIRRYIANNPLRWEQDRMRRGGGGGGGGGRHE